MGAGIVPVGITSKNIYFLFGQEHYDHKWSDFGGSKEKNESIYKTAIREGYEETDGFLGSEQYLTKLVSDKLLIKLTNKDNTYTSYLFEINYDSELPTHFNNHHKFIKHKLPQKIDQHGLFEKSKMKWFTTKELEEKLHTFRPHYKSIVRQILTSFESYQTNKTK